MDYYDYLLESMDYDDYDDLDPVEEAFIEGYMIAMEETDAFNNKKIDDVKKKQEIALKTNRTKILAYINSHKNDPVFQEKVMKMMTM